MHLHVIANFRKLAAWIQCLLGPLMEALCCFTCFDFLVYMNLLGNFSFGSLVLDHQLGFFVLYLLVRNFSLGALALHLQFGRLICVSLAQYLQLADFHFGSFTLDRQRSDFSLETLDLNLQFLFVYVKLYMQFYMHFYI